MSLMSLPISVVGGVGRNYLKLEGTVLLYIQKTWFFELSLLIPIESVRISERPRLRKEMSTLALLIPVISILLAFFYTS